AMNHVRGIELEQRAEQLLAVGGRNLHDLDPEHHDRTAQADHEAFDARSAADQPDAGRERLVIELHLNDVALAVLGPPRHASLLDYHWPSSPALRSITAPTRPGLTAYSNYAA